MFHHHSTHHKSRSFAVDFLASCRRLGVQSLLVAGMILAPVLLALKSHALPFCYQAHNQAPKAQPLKLLPEDIDPQSFFEMDGYRVYHVQLKNGQRKVLRFGEPIQVQFEDFASRFFRSFSTVKTSAVQVFNREQSLQVIEMLRAFDPELVEFMLRNAPHQVPLVSAVDFQPGVQGMKYLADHGLDWTKLRYDFVRGQKKVEELVIDSDPPLVPVDVQVQLADYWATATVLQILDPHSKNWIFQNGQVVAVDLAYPSQRRDLHQQTSGSPLDFKSASTPFSFGDITPRMRTHLISLVSQNLLDRLQNLNAAAISEMAAQSGLRLRESQIEKILARAQEILRRRHQI